ncbi:MAG: radical SAM protein [Methanomicrobiales archaeon]|nr:radical SAM protein [Methanomicrobiales archaeon]
MCESGPSSQIEIDNDRGDLTGLKHLLEGLKGKKFHIRTFGCTFNHADSERLVAALLRMGSTPASEEEAEAIVVNTCTVIQKTERKVLRTLEKFRTRDLYIMGCMPKVQMEKIRRVCSPGVIDSEELHLCAPELGVRLRGAVGAVQIAEGCNGGCRYCITRLARGPLRSYPAEAVMNAISQLCESGIREVQLTAQDVAAWGTERGESLPDLLGDLLELEGDFAIRLGMMNPASLLPIFDEIRPFFGSEHLFSFAHLPLQSGSDRVLKAMGRGYTFDDYLGMARELRSRVPDLFLATDLIAGFPGETDGDHRLSLRAMIEMEAEKVNITRYSPRPGTEAASRWDPVDRVKKERSRQLNRMAEEIYHRKNQRLLGSIFPATTVEEVRPGSVVARTPAYRTVVLKGPLPLGADVLVRLTEERMHYFLGERVA